MELFLIPAMGSLLLLQLLQLHDQRYNGGAPLVTTLIRFEAKDLIHLWSWLRCLLRLLNDKLLKSASFDLHVLIPMIYILKANDITVYIFYIRGPTYEAHTEDESRRA